MNYFLTLGLIWCLSVISLRSGEDSALPILVRTLSSIKNPEAQANILRGMNAAIKGKEGIAVPEEWDALYKELKESPNEEVRRQALALAAAFGGAGALENLRNTLADSGASPAAREAALGSLLAARDQPTLPLLLDLIKAPGPLRSPALRGLVAYDNPAIAAAVFGVFADLEAGERRDALNTLVARNAGASAILAAVDAGTIQRSEISAPLAAQLRNLRDPKIDAWVEKHWGSVRSSSAEKQKEIEQHKKFLGTEAILAADVHKGHELFLQRCTVCHKLHGEGNVIGPELPGSFKDLDYLLQNILDPNAVIGKDYQLTFVRTKDGQMISGVIAGDEDSAISLKTLAGPITIQRKNVESIETMAQSLMPEGILTGLEEDDIRNLFLYLRQSEPLSTKP